MFFKRIQFNKFDLNKYANKRLNVIYGPASHVNIFHCIISQCKYCRDIHQNAFKTISLYSFGYSHNIRLCCTWFFLRSIDYIIERYGRYRFRFNKFYCDVYKEIRGEFIVYKIMYITNNKGMGKFRLYCRFVNILFLSILDAEYVD